MRMERKEMGKKEKEKLKKYRKGETWKKKEKV